MSTQDVSTIDDVRIDGINDLVSPNEIMPITLCLPKPQH